MPTWSTLESISELTATLFEWKRISAKDFEKLLKYLTPNGRNAASLPCPNKVSCGCFHAVVQHSAADIVSVCRCNPRECESVSLTKQDIVLYELDKIAFGNSIASALGAKAEHNLENGIAFTWQIGVYQEQPGLNLPLLITVQRNPDEFKSVIEKLCSSRTTPFLLIAPTEKYWRHEYDDVLRKNKARFIALDQCLAWNGTISERLSIKDILSDFLEEYGTPSKNLYELRKNGDVWKIIYQGNESNVKDMKGMGYLATLLASPDRDVPCFDLNGTLCLIPLDVESFDDDSYSERKSRGKVIPVNQNSDADSIKNYAMRIKQCEKEIEEQEELGNKRRVSELREECHTLTKEISRSIGYRGKSRNEDPEAKKARQAVYNTIKTAKMAIKKVHPEFHKHLTSTIKTGKFLSYRPGNSEIRWAIYL